MTQQQIQEYRNCVISAIEHGAVKVVVPPLTDKEIRRITDAQRIENQRKQRESWIAQGLTSKGKPRRYLRADLSGWTDEQKRARRLEQQKAWIKRQHHEHRDS